MLRDSGLGKGRDQWGRTDALVNCGVFGGVNTRNYCLEVGRGSGNFAGV